ncbi:MAG: hypothetical protein PHG03_03420 [Bacilli bacterium]|nr:hypothetical protein [Bacilli bacterium]MDD4795592.1 hypothetical protein [Bacilli bacterium]
MASRKYKNKEVGRLEKKFCDKHGIGKCTNFKIVQSLGLIYHVQKHMNDFISVDSFNYTMLNIKEVVNAPFFTDYDSINHSIKYYKKLQEYVCVVVNITETNAFVSTVYPVNKKRINKLKQQ